MCVAQNNNVFYVYSPQTGFNVGDVTKFGVVFAIIILSTLAFLATGLDLLIALVCPAPKKLVSHWFNQLDSKGTVI